MTTLYAVHWKQGAAVGGALLSEDGSALWQATSGTVEDSLADLTRRDGRAERLELSFPDLTVVQTPWTDAPIRLIRAVMERAEVNARQFLAERECERCGDPSDEPLADGLCEGCAEVEREAGPNVPHGHTDTRI